MIDKPSKYLLIENDEAILNRLGNEGLLPMAEKELQLAIKAIKFVRDRKKRRLSGRMEIHADTNGVTSKCSVFLNDEI